MYKTIKQKSSLFLKDFYVFSNLILSSFKLLPAAKRYLFILIALTVSCEKDKQFRVTQKAIPPLETTKSSVIKERPADAQFEMITGTVSYKRDKKNTWEDAHSQVPLYYKDWVKTDKSSKTLILLESQNKITLDEKARIILIEKKVDTDVEQTIIGVTSGNIKGEVKHTKKNQELIFKLPNLWVKVSSTLKEGVKKVFRLSLSDSKIRIHTEVGDVQLITKNNNITLKENKTFESTVPPSQKKNITDIQEFSFKPDTLLKNEFEEKKEVKSKPIRKQNTELNFFRITSPKSEATVSSESIILRGFIPKGQEVYFRGKKIKAINNKFSLKVQLSRGKNIFTFQILDGNQVQYTSIGVNRK